MVEFSRDVELVSSSWSFGIWLCQLATLGLLDYPWLAGLPSVALKDPIHLIGAKGWGDPGQVAI